MTTTSKISLNKKKQIAAKILIGNRDRVPSNDVIAREENVSHQTVRRIRMLVEQGKDLSPEEIKNNPDLRRVYDKALLVWVGDMKKKITQMNLNAAEKFLEQLTPAKMKKVTANQAILGAKIAVDASLLASGQMPSSNARSVKIYLPQAANKDWRIIDEATGRVIKEKGEELTEEEMDKKTKELRK